MKGSPTCTAGRFSSSLSSNSADAIVAPWIPSRPVLAPTCPELPTPLATPLTISSAFAMPRQNIDQRVTRVALVEADFTADRRDADAVAVSGDARDDALERAAHLRRSSGPKRSAFRSAMGRAPIVKMSLMIRPRPSLRPDTAR